MSFAGPRIEEMYRRYAPGVFRRARKLMANDADAQDVVHDVFLALFERPDQFAGRSAPSTFLYSATTHACLARIRNGKNRDRLLQAYATAADGESNTPPLNAVLDLHSALRRMPERLARIAVYAWFDELTHAEIATLMGCSRRHVANLLEQVAEWSPPSAPELSCC